jgi:hypothetical protein
MNGPALSRALTKCGQPFVQEFPIAISTPSRSGLVSSLKHLNDRRNSRIYEAVPSEMISDKADKSGCS